MTRTPHAALCILVFASSLLFVGCSAQPANPGGGSASTPTTQTDSGHVEPGATEQPIAGLSDMLDATKLEKLNEAFPTEVPVVNGEVTGAAAISERELRYGLRVSAPATKVEQWYRTVLEGRAFALASEKSTPDGTELVYKRANMTYSIVIKPVAETETQVLGTITL